MKRFLHFSKVKRTIRRKETGERGSTVQAKRFTNLSPDYLVYTETNTSMKNHIAITNPDREPCILNPFKRNIYQILFQRQSYTSHS